jgi:hypothetical protein
MSIESIEKWTMYRHLAATTSESGAVQIGRVLTKEDFAAALEELPGLQPNSSDVLKKFYWGLRAMAGKRIPPPLAAYAKAHGWRRRMDTIHYVGAAVTSRVKVVAMDSHYHALFGQPMVRVLQDLHTARVAAENTHPDSDQPVVQATAAGVRVGVPAVLTADGRVQYAPAASAGGRAARGTTPPKGLFAAARVRSPFQGVATAVTAEDGEDEDEAKLPARGSPRKRQGGVFRFVPSGLKARVGARGATGVVVNLYDEEDVYYDDDSEEEEVASPSKRDNGWN